MNPDQAASVSAPVRPAGRSPAAAAAADPVAGVLAGLLAGTLYLAAQMGFARALHGGAGWEPLQRIAAMLLGPDVLPPPADIDITIGGIALLIHLSLSMVFGRVVDVLVLGRPAGAAAIRGGLVGVALYALDDWILAPALFPWFEQARGFSTLADHLLFGVVAGLAYVQLRGRLHAGAHAAAAAD